MLAMIEQARADHSNMIVFPEMCLPGYLLGDNWERESFLRECERAGEAIREASADLTIIFGNIAIDWSRKNEDGRVRKYNALFVAEDQEFLTPAHGDAPYITKTLMPNYREFDDSRYFYDTRKRALELGCSPDDLITPVDSRLGKLACILCEDGWDADYTLSPTAILSRHTPDLFVNISCSPFTLNKNTKRHRVFSEHVQATRTPLLYVNNTGIQNNGKTIYTFDGSSCAYDTHGNVSQTAELFKETLIPVTIPANNAPFGAPLAPVDDAISEICKALQYGIHAFLEMTGIERVVIGLSGGIDSAVAAALYATVIPPENLLLVNMPSQHNSPKTISIARQIADNLDCHYTSIPIEPSIDLTRQQVENLTLQRASSPESETLTLSEPVLQNIQARDRSSRILASVAASFGGAFTCNANKSEVTVGYTTLYGDLAGALACLADLWKEDVYALGHHLNSSVYGRDVIPQSCFDIVPSAELGPQQNIDKGQGDPLHYPYHDRLFKSWVERWNRATPEDILESYAANELESMLDYPDSIATLFPTPKTFIDDLEHWWNCYQGLGLAKRIQAPPILAVTRRAFGFDHREAQGGAHYSDRYVQLKNELLANA